MNGISGSWNHIQSRGLSRLNQKERKIVSQVLYKLTTKIKRKQLPNSSWYHTVMFNNKIIAYICGQGCHVSTVLSSSMYPKGCKI